MTFARPHLIREVEYTELGRVGERQLRGRVERQALDLRRDGGASGFRFSLGRMRATAVDVYEPGRGHYSVPVHTPPDPALVSLAATATLSLVAWALTRLVAHPRHTRRRR